MKKIFLSSLILISSIFLLFGCGSSRRYHRSVAKSGNDTLFIPFTRDLKQRMQNNNMDLKKVQFFVDQKLILRRYVGTEKGDIKSGVILFENGRYINEVVIPQYTPGVCEMVNGDKLMISFEPQNNGIQFGLSGAYNNFYSLYAANWNNGSADVTYDNKTYKVECGSCYNAGEAKLVVRKSEADSLKTIQRVVEGMRVDN